MYQEGLHNVRTSLDDFAFSETDDVTDFYNLAGHQMEDFIYS